MTPETFLVEDYKLRIAYLTDHLSRMWGRFSFFVSIETALIGAIFAAIAIDPDIMPDPRAFGIYLSVLGATLAIIWWIVGSGDRYLVQVYRGAVEASARRLQAVDTLKPYLEHYRYVGWVPETNMVGNSPVAWRLRTLSTTRLAGVFPLLVFLVWCIVIALSLRGKPLPLF